jgi:cell division transport system permease protein
VLLTLASLAAPFGGQATSPETLADSLAAMPLGLWMAMPGLPACAAAIGFITAQGTVRRWLRRLP